MSKPLKSQGFVRTPAAIARLLARWALRSADDHVLDPGFGAGTFLLESAKCLQALGTPADRLAEQLHGVDSRPGAEPMARQTFRSAGLPTDLPDIRTGNIFAAPMGFVDVLIGNPPATHLVQQREVDVSRGVLDPSPEVDELPRLVDPQCMFVVHAARFLKPGGRLAVILSDNWLDARHGSAFKNYLLRTFRVRGVLGFQRRIHSQLRARPVVILAEKRRATEVGKQEPVPFVSFAGSPPRNLPHDPWDLMGGASAQADGVILQPQELKPEARWTPLLYAPKAYRTMSDHPGLSPLGSLAQVRLGLQTFAKTFYVVPLASQQRWHLERRWLMPLLLSPRDFDTPCLSSDLSPRHYVLACDAAKERLGGTRVLRYIEYWENQVLTPRGQVQPVIGVQNLPRVAGTHRSPWYNLLDHLTRRGTAPILLPRRMYRRLRVLWNQAGWVAGENFIEITPRAGISVKALLAVLNTGVAELALRVNARVNGGGVYSLNPGNVGDVPVVDVRRLAPPVLSRIDRAYSQFLRTNGSERGRLDAAVFAAAGLPDTMFEDLQVALGRMQSFADDVSPPLSSEDGELPEELRLL